MEEVAVDNAAMEGETIDSAAMEEGPVFEELCSMNVVFSKVASNWLLQASRSSAS